jgi:hypothetical protein
MVAFYGRREQFTHPLIKMLTYGFLRSAYMQSTLGQSPEESSEKEFRILLMEAQEDLFNEARMLNDTRSYRELVVNSNDPFYLLPTEETIVEARDWNGRQIFIVDVLSYQNTKQNNLFSDSSVYLLDYGIENNQRKYSLSYPGHNRKVAKISIACNLKPLSLDPEDDNLWTDDLVIPPDCKNAFKFMLLSKVYMNMGNVDQAYFYRNSAVKGLNDFMARGRLGTIKTPRILNSGGPNQFNIPNQF